MSKTIEMADIVRALEKVRGGPVLTSNQCWDFAQALNAAAPVVERQPDPAAEQLLTVSVLSGEHCEPIAKHICGHDVRFDPAKRYRISISGLDKIKELNQ